MPATTPDARWASGDSSANPKIVSSFGNDAPTVRGNAGYAPMQALNLEIDPNAWELQNHDLQRLLGHACEYRKAIKEKKMRSRVVFMAQKKRKSF